MSPLQTRLAQNHKTFPISLFFHSFCPRFVLFHENQTSEENKTENLHSSGPPLASMSSFLFNLQTPTHESTFFTRNFYTSSHQNPDVSLRITLVKSWVFRLKFIYSEKVTKFCEIFPLLLWPSQKIWTLTPHCWGHTSNCHNLR